MIFEFIAIKETLMLVINQPTNLDTKVGFLRAKSPVPKCYNTYPSSPDPATFATKTHQTKCDWLQNTM